ncbi:D-beta-hydroxybutyrate dehydrogenase, mitochondrial-like isoform X2 [Pomacea canaliculata]|uniref:D-beta-hydroxybutyrate dehydrogenase, mitochondrial-like isoform X2 n=1 Tax=Pomacea canaliculata TaxID=400727 RepID=UPI000D732B5D|nr:D-beta-hydroxybutyrate dehydrogenase, mitochondrial-like isoform X2 [Pomacea canaliculata]
MNCQFVSAVFRVGLALAVATVLWSVFLPVVLLPLIVGTAYCVNAYFTAKYATREDPAGKFVLITGCDSGIGYETALAASKSGLKVFACCLDSTSSGACGLQERSSNVQVLQMDVTKTEDVEAAVNHVTKVCGSQGLWAVVNNAGFNYVAPLEVTSMETFQRLADVMLFGTVRVTKGFLPLIRKAKGRVVTMSSDRGMLSCRNSAAYCIAKHGIESFSDVLRLEMADFEVSVSIIQPGHFGAATNIINDKAVEVMRATIERDFHQAGNDVQKVYGQKSIDKVVETCVASRMSSARDLQPVTDAILDAILSSKPATRYPVHGMQGYLDWGIVLGHLRPMMPDRLMDRTMKIMHF